MSVEIGGFTFAPSLHLTSATLTIAAGVVLAATFAALAVIPLMFMVQLAFIVAFGVLLDAFVVRLLLMPALMHLLGEKAWWLPRWLDRVLPSVDFEKPLPKADIGDLIIIPDDISALAPSGADLRTVVKSAAKLVSCRSA